MTKIQDLRIIIDHCAKFPLISQKRADYELFQQAFFLIQNKEHLHQDGLQKLWAIKASMNRGLSEELKAAFPSIVPVPRPSPEIPQIYDPDWLAGFTTAEGCFYVQITKTGRVQLRFQITQHVRDRVLMENIVKYFGCGKTYTRGDVLDFRVIKFNDLGEKLLPFFQKYRIEGEKAKDFED